MVFNTLLFCLTNKTLPINHDTEYCNKHLDFWDFKMWKYIYMYRIEEEYFLEICQLNHMLNAPKWLPLLQPLCYSYYYYDRFIDKRISFYLTWGQKIIIKEIIVKCNNEILYIVSPFKKLYWQMSRHIEGNSDEEKENTKENTKRIDKIQC